MLTCFTVFHKHLYFNKQLNPSTTGIQNICLLLTYCFSVAQHKYKNKKSGAHFMKNFPNSMEIWFSCNSIIGSIVGYYIATTFCTCNDGTAVMACAKFYSDHLTTTLIRAEWNFRQIWITMIKVFVKRVPGLVGCLLFLSTQMVQSIGQANGGCLLPWRMWVESHVRHS